MVRHGELGMTLDWQRVLDIAGNCSVGRAHIALEMAERGYCGEPRDVQIFGQKQA